MVFAFYVGDNLCREMLCHLRVSETPDIEALLKTQQVTEVLVRGAPSAEMPTSNMHTYGQTILHLPESPFLLPLRSLIAFILQ